MDEYRIQKPSSQQIVQLSYSIKVMWSQTCFYVHVYFCFVASVFCLQLHKLISIAVIIQIEEEIVVGTDWWVSMWLRSMMFNWAPLWEMRESQICSFFNLCKCKSKERIVTDMSILHSVLVICLHFFLHQVIKSNENVLIVKLLLLFSAWWSCEVLVLLQNWTVLLFRVVWSLLNSIVVSLYKTVIMPGSVVYIAFPVLFWNLFSFLFDDNLLPVLSQLCDWQFCFTCALLTFVFRSCSCSLSLSRCFFFYLGVETYSVCLLCLTGLWFWLWI